MMKFKVVFDETIRAKYRAFRVVNSYTRIIDVDKPSQTGEAIDYLRRTLPNGFRLLVRMPERIE